MKKLLVLLLFSPLVLAQNVSRYYTGHEVENNFVKIQVNDGAYFIQSISPEIIETHFVPQGEKFVTQSHARVLAENTSSTTLSDHSDILTLDFGLLNVAIQKSPFQIQYLKDNELFLSEKNGYFKRKHQPLEQVQGNIVADSTEVIQFNLETQEFLFGGGSRVIGMNRRGHKLALYNKAHYGYETHATLMNYCLPLVISSKGYAIHFDNPAVGYIDFDHQKQNHLEYETIGGRKTYQVIVGNDLEKITQNYVKLTGTQPLPPVWTLGNFSSRFGYRSEREARATIDKFLQEDIPVDAIILDLYWFGKTVQGTMGNLSIDRDSFPNFEQMIADFAQKGVKTIPITEPFILTTSKKWEEAVAKNILATTSDHKTAIWDFYFGETGIIDVFKPKAQAWFWEIYKDLAQKGVAGVWGDLGEPEVFPAFAKTVAGNANAIHNVYGHHWAKLIATGYASDFPDTRPFILMRSGYSGSQRYGMMPWSGDVNRTWGGLQSQVEIALQMGMQGLGYMHSDLGGFAGDNLDDELYVRWLQYGVFNPIFRPHAQEDVASEPIYRSDWAKNLAREAIKLRYALLPYNYTTAFENAQTGTPLMRPLFFEEKDNPSLYERTDGYLWGKDILVYPIKNPGQKDIKVYLPKGSAWVDFYTKKMYEGGTTHKIALDISHIPVFVRAGAFIPMTRDIKNTEAWEKQPLEVAYYYDTDKKDSERDFYFDNGLLANAYEKGAFEMINFEAEYERNMLEIDFESEVGPNYKATEKNITFVVYNLPKKPKSVRYRGKKIAYAYDTQTLTFSTKIKFTAKETALKIKL